MLAPLGLRLAPEKTRVIHIDEGFDFLGFTIRRQRKRGTQKHYVYTKPSRKVDPGDQGQGEGRRTGQPATRHLDELITQPQPDAGGMGELLPARSVQGGLQRGRQPRLGPADALDAPQVRGHAPARDARTPTPLLRQGLEVRLNGGRVHRRLQRHGDALPLPRQQHPDPLDPETGSRRHRRLTGGKDTWSARCPERGTPGAGGGSRETAGGNTGTAPGPTSPRT